MKRHPLDPISLLFGLAFSAIGLLFLTSTDPWDWFFVSGRFDWLLPLVVLAGGAALLVSALRPGTSSRPDDRPPGESDHSELAFVEHEHDSSPD